MRVHHLLASLCVPLLLLSVARGAAKFTIDAGDVPRRNAPITVKLEVPVTPLEAGPVEVVDQDGNVLAAQIAFQGDARATFLRFIEPSLTPGKPKTYTVRAVSAPPPAQFRYVFARDNAYRDEFYGDVPVWRDVNKYDPADHANTAKTFTHIYGFHGESKEQGGFITKGPGGMDSHHRGIFFGYKVADGQKELGDFWQCADVSQRRTQYNLLDESTGPLAARCVSDTYWFPKDGKHAVVRDIRDVTTWRIAKDHFALDYEITVESLLGRPVKLHAVDAHHGGFHFRAAQEVADTPGANGKPGAAVYVRPSGAKDLGNDLWADCNWAECTVPIGNHRYSILHIDHPSNPRPTTYSTRPYGRFGAGFSTTVSQNEPLKLRYRLIIRDADTAKTSPDALVAECADFATPVRITQSK
jgi:hypothetical protein